MTKNKFISWGVSFGSMALVAGMAAFLGVTNEHTTTENNTTTSSADQYDESQDDQNNHSAESEWGIQQPSQEPFNQEETTDYSSSYRHGYHGSNPSQPYSESDSQFESPSNSEQYDTKTGGTSF